MGLGGSIYTDYLAEGMGLMITYWAIRQDLRLGPGVPALTACRELVMDIQNSTSVQLLKQIRERYRHCALWSSPSCHVFHPCYLKVRLVLVIEPAAGAIRQLNKLGKTKSETGTSCAGGASGGLQDYSI
jgi:hypothetical protein